MLSSFFYACNLSCNLEYIKDALIDIRIPVTVSEYQLTFAGTLGGNMNVIMRRPEVLAATGLCYTSIFKMMKKGTFPARRQLTARSVGWIKSEVDAWIAGLQCTTFPVLAA